MPTFPLTSEMLESIKFLDAAETAIRDRIRFFIASSSKMSRGVCAGEVYRGVK